MGVRAAAIVHGHGGPAYVYVRGRTILLYVLVSDLAVLPAQGVSWLAYAPATGPRT